MSHANVYRHFESKAALQEAVAERWLRRISDPLAAIATAPEVDGPGEPGRRLEQWVLALAEAKRRKVLDDPEMFATYQALADGARAVVDAHVAELIRQLAVIIAGGAAAGEFAVRDPEAAARVVLWATMRFHHPHLVATAPPEAELRQTVAVLREGLRGAAI